jgi:hypothetical protein
LTDWPPRDPEPEPPTEPSAEPEPHSEEAAAADDLHAAPPPPTEEPTAPLWQSPPREPDPAPEPEPELVLETTENRADPEPVAEEEPNPEAPTVTTEPTDWFEPPAIEVVESIQPIEAVEVVASEAVEEVIDEADDDEDEIVFDLSSLSTEERRHLGMRLTGAGISHIWEVGTDLVVSVEDAAVIESFVEEVRNPEGFGDEEIMSLEAESDIDDEVIYGAMSNLYVAADKLMQRPGDDATAGEFYLAADDVDGLPAPFGFDPRVWSQVLDLAAAIVTALDEESDPDGIGTNARTLRGILVNYV